MHTVFVYGTLRSGQHNNLLLTEGKAVFVGSAVSCGKNYGMAQSGTVPFLFHLKGSGAPVRGELWLVDKPTFARLDRLESHPHDYRRFRRAFRMENGLVVIAWVYLYQRAANHTGLKPREDGALYARTAQEVYKIYQPTFDGLDDEPSSSSDNENQPQSG